MPFRWNARASISRCRPITISRPVVTRARALCVSGLGAVAHATEHVELFTDVTCPTMRHHPAVVAQKAATTPDPRRREVHPRAGKRRESQRTRSRQELAHGGPAPGDAAQASRSSARCSPASSSTGVATFRSGLREVWNIPETPVAIATAVSGERSVETFAPPSDHLIAVEPNKDLADA